MLGFVAWRFVSHSQAPAHASYPPYPRIAEFSEKGQLQIRSSTILHSSTTMSNALENTAITNDLLQEIHSDL